MRRAMFGLMRIVVTGATGLVGRHLVKALALRGDDVVALSRDGDRATRQLGVPAYSWDPMAGPPPEDVLTGSDAVVHLLGESVAGGRWTKARKRAIYDSRIVGTRNLVAGIEAAKLPPDATRHKDPRPKILVSGSAVGYYGDRAEPIDETAGPGADFLAGVVKDWEAEALRAQELGLRVVLVRTGVVLQREGGALAKMLGPFKAGIGGRLGSGRQGFPWIHLADEVGLLLHALDHDEISGPMNATAPGLVDNATFSKALGRALGRPTFLPTPGFALKLLFGEMAGVILGGQHAEPAVARRTGYSFRFPEIDAALSDLLGEK